MFVSEGALNPKLKDISEDQIRLNEPETKENVRILERALDNLIDHMRENSKLFKTVYKRIFYTGSYYDGLRVKNPTEFDLNLILSFPSFRSSDLQVITNSSPASFAKCQLSVTTDDILKRNNLDILKDIFSKFFDGKYLNATKIRRWLQGVIDQTLLKMPGILGIRKIRRSESGPAITLYIITNDGTQLDVDLVPVLEFRSPSWPIGLKKPTFINPVPEEKKNWFIIPKPPATHLCSGDINIEWRLHFPGIENHLLHNKGCVKPVIKLMKLLRDKQGWKIFASYYLKTVVMWEIVKKNLDWNERNRDVLFIMMLKRLREYIAAKNLPYLFQEKYNLLLKMNSSQADNIKSRLNRIITDIERDPNRISVYMGSAGPRPEDPEDPRPEAASCKIL